MSLLKHMFASWLCIAEITFELALLPTGPKTCKSGMTYVIRLLREGETIQPELMSPSTGFDAYASSLTLTSNLITSAVMITFHVNITSNACVSLHEVAFLNYERAFNFVGPYLSGTVIAPWQFMLWFTEVSR